jgi:hypothetical protein
MRRRSTENKIKNRRRSFLNIWNIANQKPSCRYRDSEQIIAVWTNSVTESCCSCHSNQQTHSGQTSCRENLRRKTCVVFANTAGNTCPPSESEKTIRFRRLSACLHSDSIPKGLAGEDGGGVRRTVPWRRSPTEKRSRGGSLLTLPDPLQISPVVNRRLRVNRLGSVTNP